VAASTKDFRTLVSLLDKKRSMFDLSIIFLLHIDNCFWPQTVKPVNLHFADRSEQRVLFYCQKEIINFPYITN
jgi:hypothetical protein